MTIALERKSSWQDRLGDHWDTYKLPAMLLVAGLVAGPLLSNYMGWQVTRGYAERQSVASGVEQQARICAFNARADTPDTANLAWAARRDLAEKFAVMPGRDLADAGVANACAQHLTMP